MNFKLKSRYKPIADQENAIKKLVDNYKNNKKQQVLLGVTGSGKTFTMANVIERLNMPTLILSHNKTLAAQLYQEFRDYFPDNAVSYFVSYYDYYQPEAYIPSTDTYIEKDAGINALIDKLRLAATTNLLTRKDTIIIASVSAIYNIGSPVDYGKFVFQFKKGQILQRENIIDRLIDLQYERSDFGFYRGSFRVRGNNIDIFPAYQDEGIRIEEENSTIGNISIINTVSGEIIKQYKSNETVNLYPAKHFMTDQAKSVEALNKIRSDMKDQISYFKSKGKIIEAERIKRRVTYDLEMLEETGYVKGIENYSRYFDGRKPGESPYSLIEYFKEPYKDKWLLFVDESHITFPQIRGMYNGDRSRKQTLIDYGFRLPSTLDNRPLTFDEFLRKINNFIAASATPDEWEISRAIESGKDTVVEQLIRPTGIPDPQVFVRSTKNQVEDITKEIIKRATKKERTLVNTLTKQMAEDLSEFLKEKNIKVQYLHSDVKTLERTDILDDLRGGKYDCLVGINLLREGLDLPEVSLVAILDADKEGFLRSKVSLIQTMGRAARHVNGQVILYADNITKSIKAALEEVERRREKQIRYNKEFNITPKSVIKPIREKLIDLAEIETLSGSRDSLVPYGELKSDMVASLTPMDKRKLLSKLRNEMRLAAKDLNFELAITIRDKIKEIDIN